MSLGTETLGHGHSSLEKTLFTLILDCETPTEWKWVSDQTWICPATVRACAHAAALTVMSTNHAPGEAPHVVEVKDQRLSAFLVSLLLGVSVQLSSVLKQVQQCNTFNLPRHLSPSLNLIFWCFLGTLRHFVRCFPVHGSVLHRWYPVLRQSLPPHHACQTPPKCLIRQKGKSNTDHRLNFMIMIPTRSEFMLKGFIASFWIWLEKITHFRHDYQRTEFFDISRITGQDLEAPPVHGCPGVRSGSPVGYQVLPHRPLLPLLCRPHGPTQDVTQVHLHTRWVGKCKCRN